jgi:hypothetical protein
VGLDFVRALLATGVLPPEDQALAERLAVGVLRAGERRRVRTSAPLLTFACMNCDGPAADAPWVYCSPLCAEMASTIRYGRAIRADGRIRQADVREAFRIRIASVNGGGYQSEERQLTRAQRQAVVDRDQGRCQTCGAAGSEIDHIAGPVDAIAGLRTGVTEARRFARDDDVVAVVLGVGDGLHGALVGLVGLAAADLGQRTLGVDGQLVSERPGGLRGEQALALGSCAKRQLMNMVVKRRAPRRGPRDRSRPGLKNGARSGGPALGGGVAGVA